MSGMKYID